MRMIDGPGSHVSRNRGAWIAAGLVAIVAIDHLTAADVHCALLAFGASLVGAFTATRIRRPA